MCAQPLRKGQQVKYRYHLKEIYVYWKKKVAKNWYLKIFASSVLLKNRYVKYYRIHNLMSPKISKKEKRTSISLFCCPSQPFQFFK